MHIAVVDFSFDKIGGFEKISENYKDKIIYYYTIDELLHDYYNNNRTYMAIFIDDETTQNNIEDLRSHVKSPVYLAKYEEGAIELDVDNFICMKDATKKEFDILIRSSERVKELLDSEISIDDDFYHFEFFKKIIHIEIKRAKRYDIDLSLFYMTIDNIEYMKERNESFFTEIIKIVTTSIRDIDLPINIGDEGLLILMPHTDKMGAATVAERIFNRIGKTPKLKFSISIVTSNQNNLKFSTMMTQLHEGIEDSRVNGSNRIVIK